MPTKHVLISGGAGGLGSSSARHLAGKGWHVFASDLPGAALDSIGREKGITSLPLDVTDSESIERAAAVVRDQSGGLDGVVNFAGILALGSMAEIAVEDFERVIDINLLGTFRVNRAFVPMLFERKGRIVNISSETGWETAAPFNGAYAISKHAIEAYNDTLRRELMFLGIDVVKIQPGPFKTDMVHGIGAAFDRAASSSAYFGSMLTAVKDLAIQEQDKARDPKIIADVVHRALTAKKPKIAYSVHPDPARAVLSYLPDRLVDMILKRVLARVSRNAGKAKGSSGP
jgi:NAD(P)-dependent dehydrogenase (short-subunit alcohol dehydrogenase family)